MQCLRTFARRLPYLVFLGYLRDERYVQFTRSIHRQKLDHLRQTPEIRRVVWRPRGQEQGERCEVTIYKAGMRAGGGHLCRDWCLVLHAFHMNSCPIRRRVGEDRQSHPKQTIKHNKHLFRHEGLFHIQHSRDEHLVGSSFLHKRIRPTTCVRSGICLKK